MAKIHSDPEQLDRAMAVTRQILHNSTPDAPGRRRAI
jgi:hypothetical protein